MSFNFMIDNEEGGELRSWEAKLAKYLALTNLPDETKGDADAIVSHIRQIIKEEFAARPETNHGT